MTNMVVLAATIVLGTLMPLPSGRGDVRRRGCRPAEVDDARRPGASFNWRPRG